MNYNSTYATFTRRALFPPVVPSSIPAFDGMKPFKIFFKKSAANFIGGVGQGARFQHVQVSIRRVDNNANALNTTNSKYKTGYIICELSEQCMDDRGFEPTMGKAYKVYRQDEKSPYCLFLNGRELGGNVEIGSFSELNTLYKVQLRLGEDAYNPNLTVKDIQNMNAEGRVSEWSSVLTMKPIDRPDFGIQGFYSVTEDKDKLGNKISTANNEYVAYYKSLYTKYNSNGQAVFTTVNEKLSEYWFKLYSTNNELLSDSGPIVAIEHDRQNISHTFNYLTKDQVDYYVVFGIKTENGYVGEEKYLVSADYKALEMSNAMVRVTNERDRARMKLEIQAKQVVLEPIVKPGTKDELSKLGFIKDETNPQFSGLPALEQNRITSTHAIIEGVVKSSKSFYLSCPNDTWTVEAKLSGLKCYNTKDEALKNPYILLENEHSIDKEVLYMTRVLIICYKEQEFDYGLDLTKIVTDSSGFKSFAKKTTPAKDIYYIEAIKTSYKKENGKEIKIQEQRSRHRSAIRTKLTKDEPSAINQRRDLDQWIDEFLSNPKHPGGVNQYEWKDSDETLIDVPAAKLLDISYTNNQDYSKPNILSTTEAEKKAFIANESIDFDPKKEYYLFLTNNLGSFAMYLMDGDYVTTDRKFIEYLETKRVPNELLPTLREKNRDKGEI